MRKLWVMFALLALVGGLLAGCGAQITAPEIIQHMKDTAAQTTDAHLVVDLNAAMTASDPTAQTGPLAGLPTSGKATIELWYQKPNLVRAEVRSMDPAAVQGMSLAGATVVGDGKALWAYDPTHKMAYKLDMSALQGAGQMLNMPTDLQELVSDPNLATVLDRVLSLTDARLDGNEVVAGFQTYKLTLTPKADTGLANAALNAQVTMWVDQATWAVVKLEATSTSGTFSYSAQTLEFNKGVPAETFKFTPPAGARGIDLTMFAPRPTTLEAAQTAAQAAGWSLLTPADALGATLTGVTALPMGHGYLLSYSGSASAPKFTIYESKPGSMGAMPFGGQMGGLGAMSDPMEKMMNGEKPDWATVQTVQVRGVEGQAFTRTAPASGDTAGHDGTFVTWQESGSGLRLGIGGALSLADTLKLAESLK